MVGLFISFEGVDGSGKSTQLERLAARLRASGHVVRATREPGGTGLGDAIRRLVLEPGGEPLAPRAELALMVAARAQHIAQVIAPALAAGETVLCDRFADATEAYQGVARGLGVPLTRELHRLLCGDVQPNLTLVLDLDPAVAVARARGRLGASGSAEGRFEAEGLAFFTAVRQAHAAIAAREPGRCALIAAEGDIAAVERRVAAAVRERLGLG